MQKMMWMLLMLVTLSSFFASSQAVTCYTCYSSYSPDCGDPFEDSSKIKTCPGTVCAKTTYEEDGKEVVARACDNSNSRSIGCESSTVGGQPATVCFCDSDKCNGAMTVLSLGQLMVVLALIINVIIDYLLY